MTQLIQRFVREEDGQDLIEYALLAGFISLVAVAAITSVGTGVNGVYNSVDAQVQAIPAAVRKQPDARELPERDPFRVALRICSTALPP